VLRLVADGLSEEAIAERLVISPHTVHRHVANVRTKLRQPSRAAAVAHAARGPDLRLTRAIRGKWPERAMHSARRSLTLLASESTTEVRNGI
jgi:Bacterial regulatory proteins, luxR family